MINGDERYRVWNRAKFDIGLRLMSGVEMNIRPGSFQILTANDIIYIEATYTTSRFFGKKLLVITDDQNREIEITTLGLQSPGEDAHQNDNEILAHLKSSNKKLEEWISQIEDKEELHAIYEVATSEDVDLPLNKIKILRKYMPDKDWLDELG